MEVGVGHAHIYFWKCRLRCVGPKESVFVIGLTMEVSTSYSVKLSVCIGQLL